MENLFPKGEVAQVPYFYPKSHNDLLNSIVKESLMNEVNQEVMEQDIESLPTVLDLVVQDEKRDEEEVVEGVSTCD